MAKTKMITTQAYFQTPVARASASMQDRVNEAIKQNASAFMQHVSQAIKHILIINKSIADLSDTCTVDVLCVLDAIVYERTRLITTLPAYYQADKVLTDLMPYVSERLRYTTHASTTGTPKT